MISQVFTRKINDSQPLDKIIQWPIPKISKFYVQPEIDFNKYVEDDLKAGRKFERIGVKYETNFNEGDGEWFDLGGIFLWQLGISAPKASSIAVTLSNVHFSENSEMVIASEDLKIIHGPITIKDIYNFHYSSDIIESKKNSYNCNDA